jgi:hypothetical protein
MERFDGRRRRLLSRQQVHIRPALAAPDLIVLKRHRDLEGRRGEAWARRAILLVLVAALVAALANAFGQHASDAARSAPDAELEVRSPTVVRGGLLYQVRFTVSARHELKKAILVLDRDWLEGLTINTVEPAPLGEASRNGDLALELGHVPAGQRYVFYLQYQVNPTSVGRRRQTATLLDDERRIVSISRSLTIYP